MKAWSTFGTLILSAALVALPVPAQRKYAGPRPPKPDVPFLLHADNLVELESGQAQEEKRKNDTVTSVPGASSPVRTPLAEPIFLLLTSKLEPGQLELWKLEPKGGARLAIFPDKPKRDGPRPLRVMVSRLDENLYRLEVNETLENGEYALSPRGSNQVFCFQVY